MGSNPTSLASCRLLLYVGLRLIDERTGDSVLSVESLAYQKEKHRVVQNLLVDYERTSRSGRTKSPA